MKTKMKKKEKSVQEFPAMHNMERFKEQPSEMDCPKCKKTGWLGEQKCDKCDGYGILTITMIQRMHLSYGDCYLDKEKGQITYYV